MAIGVAGGHALGVELLGVDAGSYWSQIRANVDIHDLLQSLLKSTVFGSVISWIAVYQGYNAAPTSEGVSRATTSTVVVPRSEEHTSELQSLMRSSYAVF